MRVRDSMAQPKALTNRMGWKKNKKKKKRRKNKLRVSLRVRTAAMQGDAAGVVQPAAAPRVHSFSPVLLRRTGERLSLGQGRAPRARLAPLTLRLRSPRLPQLER